MPNLEQTRQAWEHCAEAYDRALTDLDMEVAERALQLSGVRQGMRFLDVAAGPGALSIPAARLGADVLAIDYSHAMVELLRHKAARLGLSNLRTAVMDGTALELDDEVFDVAGSELGIMLFPDRARGLREMARIIRGGGRGVMIALGHPLRVPAVSLFFDAMQKAIATFVPPTNSPLFCLHDPHVLKREMEQAGFQDVRVELVEGNLKADSEVQLWANLVAGAPALVGLMEGISAAERRAVRRMYLDGVRERFGAAPLAVPMAFNVGIGTKAVSGARPATD